MKHFYATVEGIGNIPRTCTGTKDSGIIAQIQGKTLGIKVSVKHLNGHDHFNITINTGANDEKVIKTLGTYYLDNNGFLVKGIYPSAVS